MYQTAWKSAQEVAGGVSGNSETKLMLSVERGKWGHIILPPPPPFYQGLGGGFMIFVPWIFPRSLSSAMGFTLTLKVICLCAFMFFYVSFEGSRRNCGDSARFGCYSVANLPLLWLLAFNRFLGWFEILHLMLLVQELFCCLLSLLRAIQHWERGTPTSAGAATTLLFCDATTLLGPWNKKKKIATLP